MPLLAEMIALVAAGFNYMRTLLEEGCPEIVGHQATPAVGQSSSFEGQGLTDSIGISFVFKAPTYFGHPGRKSISPIEHVYVN